MKYFQTKIILLFLISLLGLNLKLNAQNGKNVSDDFQKQSKRFDEKSIYEFWVGERLGIAFSEKCQFFTGTVNKFDGRTVGLAIQKYFYGNDITGNRILLKYTPPRKNLRFSSEGRSAWDYVEVQEGKELFVTRCLGSGGLERYKVILGNQNLFPIVKEIVSYHIRLQKSPKIILDALKLLEKKNSDVSAGYLRIVLTTRSLSDENDRAIVQSRLFVNKNASEDILSFAGFYLTGLLSNVGENALSPETRKLITKNIIEAAAASNGKAVEKAIRLLINLSEKGKIDINPFLSKKKRRDLSRNYHSLTLKNVSEQGRKEFERQLAGN